MGMLFISVIDSTTTNTKVGVHEEVEVQESVVPEPFPSTGELPEEYVMLST
jgi:hypothetical protein